MLKVSALIGIAQICLILAGVKGYGNMELSFSASPELIAVKAGNDSITSIEENKISLERNVPNAIFYFKSVVSNQEFQYKIGVDSETPWSLWTRNPYLEVYSVPNQDFELLVRSRTGSSQSEIVQYSIAVEPGWYQSLLSYLVYLLIFIGLSYYLIHSRSKHFIQEKKELEQTIDKATQQIRSQAEMLEEQSRRLKEADELKSKFYTNISHDFRTPLTLLIGPIEELLKSVDNEEIKKSLRIMLMNAKTLLRLINQLLELAKLESGKMNLDLKQGDLVPFIDGILSNFKNYAQFRNVTLETNVKETSITGYFDPIKLEQIMFNLLSNAFKFTPDGGTINVRVKYKIKQEGKQDIKLLILTIEDSGVGIKESEREHLFDRFYQSDPSDLRGTGIGLALTKELVELHKGKISVASKNIKGTKFTVEIPINKDHYNESDFDENLFFDQVAFEYANPEVYDSVFEDTTSYNSEMPDVEGDKQLVLLVEDNIEVKNFITNNLGERFSFKEANNGVEGLKIARELIPDMIISDIMMPGMDGMEFCNQIRKDERTSHIPVIILTAKAGLDSRIKGYEKGADDYITKPFSINELESRIINIIKQRDLLRKRFQSHVFLDPRELSITDKDQQFLERAIKVVEERLSDPLFTAEMFQKNMGMSRMQLHRKLKALTEKSASEFIKFIRINRAAQLIYKDTGAVSEIAYQVGFSDPSYFTKCFKMQFGVAPSEYKGESGKVQTTT